MPGYQTVPSSSITTVVLPDGAGSVRVIADHFGDARHRQSGSATLDSLSTKTHKIYYKHHLIPKLWNRDSLGFPDAGLF
jgi:hypothetical protein